MMMARSWLVCLVVGVAGCVPAPPAVVDAGQTSGQTGARFEPAPVPHGGYRRSDGSVSVYDAALPPKMPPGTGAVPVSNSPVRGTVMTGWKQSF